MFIVKLIIDEKPYLIVWDFHKKMPMEGSTLMQPRPFQEWYKENMPKAYVDLLGEQLAAVQHHGTSHNSPNINVDYVFEKKSRITKAKFLLDFAPKTEPKKKKAKSPLEEKEQ